MPNNNQSEEVDLIGDIAEKMMFSKSRELDEKHYPFIKKLTDDEYTNFRDTIRQTRTTHGASEYARGIQDAIKLSDELEASDTEFNEWRAFKGFRNALRDKLQALSQENTLKE